MVYDFSLFYEQYITLTTGVDSIFNKMKFEYPDLVQCRLGCSSCCHALFDISLVEAIYINQQFNEMYSGKKRDSLLEKANKADRKIYKFKHHTYKDYKSDLRNSEILDKFADERVMCPMLNDDETCDIYDFRPLACRLYGIPTSSEGVSHICGQTGFDVGESYPTVNMDSLFEKLYNISHSLVKSIKVKNEDIYHILVPLSMSLLTVYDETYFNAVP